jgi:hypothetical protein
MIFLIKFLIIYKVKFPVPLTQAIISEKKNLNEMLSEQITIQI